MLAGRPVQLWLCGPSAEALPLTRRTEPYAWWPSSCGRHLQQLGLAHRSATCVLIPSTGDVPHTATSCDVICSPEPGEWPPAGGRRVGSPAGVRVHACVHVRVWSCSSGTEGSGVERQHSLDFLLKRMCHSLSKHFGNSEAPLPGAQP